MNYVKSVEEIKKDVQQVKGRLIAGVYFLLKGETIVYVGQSMNCEARVHTHVVSGKKDFDTYSIIPIIDECERNDTEIVNILKYTPRYNKNIPPALDGSKCFYTKKEIWLNRHSIGNRKIEAYIFAGQIFILKEDIE